MKIDFISCTKMLYFAEKVLADGGYENFARQSGMTEAEVSWICDQFEHDKLLKFGSMPTERENKYGEMISEDDYEFLAVDKVKFKKFIAHIKSTTYLRHKPFIPREAVVSIAKQIEATLEKDELVRAVSAFDSMSWCLENKTYTLTDFLFRYAYAKGREETLPVALAEFLNPIYYGMRNRNVAEELFEYIDTILAKMATKEDYKEWIKEAGRYIQFPRANKLIEKVAVSLKDKNVEFDDAKPAIVVDGKSCPLPTAKNEDYLARALFARPVGEYVDWSIIHGEMTGIKEVIGDEKDMKSVRDTMNRLNKRIKEVIGTEDEFLSWQNKSIKRNY